MGVGATVAVGEGVVVGVAKGTVVAVGTTVVAALVVGASASGSPPSPQALIVASNIDSTAAIATIARPGRLFKVSST